MAVQQGGGGGYKPGGGFQRPAGGGGFQKPGGFNKGGFRNRFPPRREAEHRINHFIRVPQVRLVGENVEVGVYSTQDALKIAQEQGLDLVEISPQADPPVCKIIDYNKFLYDKKKKEKEMKAKSKTSEVKEIRFTPNTDDHDFDFKSRHAENFLKEGDKVKAYVQFKGRAIQFKDRGELLLLKFADRLKEVGAMESMPKLEGKRMIAIFTPKGKKKPQ
jgi:translation initiation factor IF-3